MWMKPRIDEQQTEKAPEKYGASIYLEAYNYALDLCDNPAIAREVASRFINCLETGEQPVKKLVLEKA
ncbi:MAG: hypothetical protein ONB46_14560 [candidate division KSB1 bacterium]|nr:hypothetical protein [candidate division KSB1 bacterium]MDZ7364272.1 hypothetical protein [candidate division KSB1 bacterium]MDZ7404995.1 hypothetical protein [candidate division KSB1 bacterium]